METTVFFYAAAGAVIVSLIIIGLMMILAMAYIEWQERVLIKEMEASDYWVRLPLKGSFYVAVLFYLWCLSLIFLIWSAPGMADLLPRFGQQLILTYQKIFGEVPADAFRGDYVTDSESGFIGVWAFFVWSFIAVSRQLYHLDTKKMLEFTRPPSQQEKPREKPKLRVIK